MSRPRPRSLTAGTPLVVLARLPGMSPGEQASEHMPGLVGKVALVTGASRWIGRAIALRPGRESAFVVVNYSGNAQAAQETVTAVEGAGGMPRRRCPVAHRSFMLVTSGARAHVGWSPPACPSILGGSIGCLPAPRRVTSSDRGIERSWLRVGRDWSSIPTAILRYGQRRSSALRDRFG
jgi:hypothetical protein